MFTDQLSFFFPALQDSHFSKGQIRFKHFISSFADSTLTAAAARGAPPGRWVAAAAASCSLPRPPLRSLSATRRRQGSFCRSTWETSRSSRESSLRAGQPAAWKKNGIDFKTGGNKSANSPSLDRFGKGLGREYAEAYSLQYWREGMQGFRNYRDSMGREVSACVRACVIAGRKKTSTPEGKRRRKGGKK